MSSRTRWIVFLVSTPLVALAAIGGLIGAAPPSQGGYAELRIFNDVYTLIRDDYVQPVDMDKVMEGGLRGLADGLDPNCAYLTPAEVQFVQSHAAFGPADPGVTVEHELYLRVLGVRAGSPAAKAGLRTNDYIRTIDGKSTREMSWLEGMQALHGAPGSKISLTVIRDNAAEPQVLDLLRDAPTDAPVTSRRLPGGEWYVHVASFAPGAAAALKEQVEAGRAAGAPSAVIDLRGTADGTVAEAIAAARLFVKSGALATLADRAKGRTVTSARAGDGAVALPVALLVSSGTAGPAEVFAAALGGNGRADLVGGRTAGLASEQALVPLPDGRGLWLTEARYLRADGQPILDRGVPPTIAVEEPTVAFGAPAPATDDVLAAAVAHLKAKTPGVAHRGA